MRPLSASTQEALIKALALRAFLEMDWEEVAPPRDELDPWLSHWSLVEAACLTDWAPEVLWLTNRSWAHAERFACQDELRAFVGRHAEGMRKSLERHRAMAGWG